MTEQDYKEYQKLETLKYQLDKVHPYVLISHDSKFDEAAAKCAERFNEFIKNEIKIAEELQRQI